MSRGIRIADDDPLFIIMEANELHFAELVERHFKVLDQHVIAKIVALSLAKYAENQAQKAQLKCAITTDVQKSVARLESASYTLSNFEERMSETARSVARPAARETAGQVLSKLAFEVSTGLARFEALKPEAAAIGDRVAKATHASNQIHAAVRRVEAWWLGFAGLLVAVLFIGMFLGHLTTTGAYERVQAACISATTSQR